MTSKPHNKTTTEQQKQSDKPISFKEFLGEMASLSLEDFYKKHILVRNYHEQSDVE